MNSRSCRWLVWALLITASDAWTQQSASPASDQTLTTAQVSGTPKAAQCTAPAYDQKSVAALKRQAASGNAAAQCKLGYLYNTGEGVPQDYTQAAFWFRKAAEQGNADAPFFLMILYSCETGYSRPQDYPQAVAFFRKAAEEGDAHAQNELGCWYARGKGAPQDYVQAAVWYRKAAEQSDAGAQAMLGILYLDGQGVPQDYAQAALWWRKAAEMGYYPAQHGLGICYHKGIGVPYDDAQAAFWFRKAADQGDAEAQDALGDLYLGGQGVPQDYAEAYFWYDLAAAGAQDASASNQVAKFRDEAASHLTPADLSHEQERVQKWVQAHPAKPQ